MSPPVLNEMSRGARLAKSFAGLTTLAAMFTEIVAMPTPSSAMTATSSARRRRRRSAARSSPGGGVGEVSCDEDEHRVPQLARRRRPCRIACDALVMTTPIAEKAIIVVGRPERLARASARAGPCRSG